MIPGLVRNCSRTSKTTRPAARDTALIARPENRNTTAAPMIRPNSRLGCSIDREKSSALPPAPRAHDRPRPERAEQRGRGEHGGGDRDALGDGLGGVADRVEAGEDERALLGDLAGHLGDALRVVADRAEGVHRDDDADGGEQTGAGQRDGEQRDDRRAAAEQERRVDRAADEQRGVDGRLEADGDAGQDDGGRAGERALADLLDRLAVGLGEVAGEHLDEAGQHDADDDRADGDDARVAAEAWTPSSP